MLIPSPTDRRELSCDGLIDASRSLRLRYFARFARVFGVLAGGLLADGVDAVDARHVLRLLDALTKFADFVQALGTQWIF